MPTTINASNTTGGAVVTGDGSGILELQSGGVTGITVNGPNVTVAGTLTATGGISALTTPVIVTGSSTAGAEIRLPEDTDNGSNYVAIKAPDALAANVTFTLPTADGASGQFLRTDGSGALSFASVSPGGTTGQIQYNNAGAFGGLSSGTSGQVLVSQGAGNAPTWGAATTTYNQVGDFISTTSQFLFYAAGNSNALTQRGWTPGVARFTDSTFSGSNPAIPTNISWSNYYNAWYGLISTLNPAASGVTTYIAFSNDGINWWPAAPVPTDAPRSIQSFPVVDDSNGRFFFPWNDTTAYTAGVIYQTTPGNFDAWTTSSAIVTDGGYSTTPTILDMQYVNFGTTGTSGIVLAVYRGANFSSTTPVYVIAAGTTTATLKANRSTVSGGNGIISWDATNKKCVVIYSGNSTTERVTYVENDVNGTWTNPSVSGVGTNGFQNADAGGGYALMVTSTTGYIYSNTFSSWTSASPPAGNIQTVWHNGTYWFMRTTTGVYYTATGIPTGWTRIGTTNWLATNQTASKSRRSVARKI